MEVILFPDAEHLVTTYLSAQLHALGLPIPVVTRVPASRPGTFVRVMRTGGVRRSLILDNPQITVEAWAETEADAIVLAAWCRGILESAQTIETVPIYDVAELSGPANLPDPKTAQTRYTATYMLLVRGHAA